MNTYEFLLIALIVLACPISMWLMMRRHHGRGQHGASDAMRHAGHHPQDTHATR